MFCAWFQLFKLNHVFTTSRFKLCLSQPSFLFIVTYIFYACGSIVRSIPQLSSQTLFTLVSFLFFQPRSVTFSFHSVNAFSFKDVETSVGEPKRARASAWPVGAVNFATTLEVVLVAALIVRACASLQKTDEIKCANGIIDQSPDFVHVDPCAGGAWKDLKRGPPVCSHK